jgi:RHS repeat-associated protein
MSYTTTHGNPAFVPVAAFTNTGLETEQYYFHPDHLGSSNYITNIAGEVSQHTEYFAFGETFVEEHKGSNNSPYKFNGKELDNESGLYYYGARYYDPRISIWASVDPLAEETMDSYGYCFKNPVYYFEPDGCSPISYFLKTLMKVGAKKAIKEFAENQIKKRLKIYTKHLADKQFKKFGKEFAKDLDIILGDLDAEWWETAIEMVPVAGDVYGTSQFALKLKKAYDRLQDLENKYIGKLDDLLPKSLSDDIKKKMRNHGINDAKIDQKNGFRDLINEEKYIKNQSGDIKNNIEGHHKVFVSHDASQMGDPRNILFKTHTDHKKIHNKGKKVHRSSRYF